MKSRNQCGEFALIRVETTWKQFIENSLCPNGGLVDIFCRGGFVGCVLNTYGLGNL